MNAVITGNFEKRSRARFNMIKLKARFYKVQVIVNINLSTGLEV